MHDNYESFLIKTNILSSSKIDEFRNEISNEIKSRLIEVEEYIDATSKRKE